MIQKVINNLNNILKNLIIEVEKIKIQLIQLIYD